MADEAMAQPNDEAANHHAALVVKGQDTGGEPQSTTLDRAAQQGVVEQTPSTLTCFIWPALRATITRAVGSKAPELPTAAWTALTRGAC